MPAIDITYKLIILIYYRATLARSLRDVWPIKQPLWGCLCAGAAGGWGQVGPMPHLNLSMPQLRWGTTIKLMLVQCVLPNSPFL